MEKIFKNKKYIKLFSFLFFFAIALTVASVAVSPEGEVYDIVNTEKKIRDIGKEDRETIDVMFTGNSLVFRAISPLQIYHDYGITGYDMSDGAMRLCDQCAILKSSYRRQTPDLIVIEPYVMFSDSSPHKNSYALPTNFIEDIFPIFHYHPFYKAYTPVFLNEDDNELDEDDVDGMKGFQYSEKTVPYTGDPDYMSKENGKSEITDENLYYLSKILAFTKKNDISLLIAAIPSPVNYNLSKHEAIQNWADTNGVDFLDMNLLTGEIGIDWNTDTKDAGDHMNLTGSRKVSAYLGAYISEHYSLKDHRGDEDYSEWTEDAEACGLYNN